MHLNLTIEELIESFALFDDWEDRYRYLIEMGEALPDMPEDLKTDQNKVQGCMSQVWMLPSQTEQGHFDFLADSDAMIVKGLIAVLKVIYAGKKAEEMKNIDIEDIFGQLGLEQHLSPNRRNGFYAMVGHIQKLSSQS